MAHCRREANFSDNTNSYQFSFLWAEVDKNCKNEDSLKVFLYNRGFKNVVIEYQRQSIYFTSFETKRSFLETKNTVFPNEKEWYFSEKEGLKLKQ